MAILLSRSKSLLVKSLLAADENSGFVRSRACLPYLEDAFPKLLSSKYQEWLLKHPLKDEIIATFLANICISDMGICYVQQMVDETGCKEEVAIVAYHLAVDIYRLRDVTKMLHDHAYHFDRRVFLEIYDDIRSLLRHTAKWLIQNINLDNHEDSLTLVKSIAQDIDMLRGSIEERLSQEQQADIQIRKNTLEKYSIPEDINEKIVYLRYYMPLINIAYVTQGLDGVKSDYMSVYYALAKRFNIGWLLDQLEDYNVDTVWTQVAKVSMSAEVELLQRNMAMHIYKKVPDEKDGEGVMAEKWLQINYGEALQEWDAFFADLSTLTQYDFAIFSVMIQKLSNLNKVFARLA